MMRLQTVTIRNFRGILDLNLELSGRNFVVQGPNGSGKSGVVDAIEFALTGAISRLKGTGTAGLTPTRHGPHVDTREHPEDSQVSLSVISDVTGQSVTILRTLDHPRSPQISPDTPQNRELFAALQDHPEFVLSRREIIKYILAESATRAQQIQALLKLERVDRFRAALTTASNQLAKDLTRAVTNLATAKTALKAALTLDDLSRAPLLAEVNRLRLLAGVAPLDDITGETRFDAGVMTSQPRQVDRATQVSRKAVEADLKTLRDLFAEEARKPTAAAFAQCAGKLDELRKDPTLVADLERERFLELGLEYFDGKTCPFCDTAWSDSTLREHVNTKLARLAKGKEAKATLITLGQQIRVRCQTVERPLRALESVAKTIGAAGNPDLTSTLSLLISAQGMLGSVPEMLTLSFDGLSPVVTMTTEVSTALALLEEAIGKLPDDTKREGAASLLIQAQTRLEDVMKAKLAHDKARKPAEQAQLALRLYDETAEAVLSSLYQQVEANFAKYYRILHEEDEGDFRAELRRQAGSVDIDVDFYGRGLFPPGAYHSEGHQDGMGLCLYLALMQQVLGKAFSFAVLDDVVMSVDSSHRHELCRLLKQHFPGTQFILTTHDKVWLGQLHSSGLVAKNATLVFSRWSVDHGPFLAGARDVWDEIQAHLDADRVSDGAAMLRRHLEEVSLDLADRLRAEVPLRIDCRYELEDLLPRATSRWKDLLGKAITAAQSWGDNELKTTVQARKESFMDAIKASNVERWAINSAVHYNQWANFSREDFLPVVAAFRNLLAGFCCLRCGLWLYLSPQTPGASTLRCPCGTDTLNLDPRPRDIPLNPAGPSQRQSAPPGSPSA